MTSSTIDSKQFSNCPACNKPLSKDRSKQLTYLANGVAVTFVLLALGFIWCVRNPYAVQNTLAPFLTVKPGQYVSVSSGSSCYNTERITLDKFKALKGGMSLEQARRVLGSPGTRTGEARVEGVSTILYHWQRRDGASISAAFRRDKLAFKASYGLKPKPDKPQANNLKKT